MNKHLVMLLLSSLAFIGCTSLKEGTNAGEKISKITYRYIDSSVPPQYHRSYSIEVYPTSIILVVDSYGDILLNKTFESQKETFDAAIASFRSGKIKKGKIKEDRGCTGGTSEKVTLHSESTTLFSAYVYHCMGDWGDLRGNIAKFSSEMKALIPDLESVIAGL